MKEMLKTIIKDWQKSFPRADVRERTLKIPLDSKKIISLIGPRRCGKTYYLFQIINHLVEKGKGDKIVYINFEDERLDLSTEQLQLVLEAYYELYPENTGRELYLLFDEIQEISGWEKFVRRMYDTVTRNIFITGSSAKIMSQEIATSLRGRNLVYQLFPLSFKEYCEFQDSEVTDIYTTRAKALMKSKLRNYLKWGGYPETISMKEELIQKTLQSYFDVMLFRDIVERHAISNTVVLKQFLKKILNNIANKLSVHKFYNDMKSQGIVTSKDAIYEYLDHALDCFLLFIIYPVEPSITKQQSRARKVYAIDTGLVNAVTYRFSEDQGKLLENLIFLQLIRKGHSVFYGNDHHECDFIIRRDSRISHVIQVCQTLQDTATRQREIRGALQSAKRFKLRQATIITFDEEDEIKVEGKKILVRPGWKWLLAGEFSG